MSIQRHWRTGVIEINSYETSNLVGDVLHTKGLSVGFMLKPNFGSVLNTVTGLKELGPKKGSIALVIVPDSTMRKNKWLEDRTSGFVDLGQFAYEDSQIFNFDVIIDRESGEANTLPEIGQHQFTQDMFVLVTGSEEAVFNCEVQLTIETPGDITQHFNPLLINLIKTKKPIGVGFHVDDHIEV